MASAGMTPAQLQQKGPLREGPLQRFPRGTPPEAAAPEAAGATGDAAAAEASAAEAAIRGSLWEQGQTPLRTLMESCSVLKEAPGSPLLRRGSRGSSLSAAAAAAAGALAAAAHKRSSSRTSSFSSVHGSTDTPAIWEGGHSGWGRRERELDPLTSLDVQAIRYHLLPSPLMHCFEGRGEWAHQTQGAPSSSGLLPQTPPPERKTGDDPQEPLIVKRGGKNRGQISKKKKGALDKDGMVPGNRRLPSTLLPTIDFYWGPPPIQGIIPSQGPTHEATAKAPLTGVEAMIEEDMPLGVLRGVCCLEANRFVWIPETKLKVLLMGIAQGLRCLTLVGCKVGEEAHVGLNGCSKQVTVNSEP
ncbi:hypothetical protein ACSSS7_000791 [Eimeria intestinalis]